MARPTRDNASYFTHFADFRNDRRVKSIRARFGVAGYGLLMLLIEVLTESDHTQISTDELEMELLAGDFGVSVTEIDSLLQLAEKIGLFSRNSDGNLICEDLNRWLEPVFSKRNRSRDAAKDKPKPVTVTETPITVTESTQRRKEKSKEENNNTGSEKPARKPPSKSGQKTGYPEAYELFWKLYAKPTADKKEGYAEWLKLKPDEQTAAVAVLAEYKTHQPEARYRKDPERYLKARLWENDFSAPPAVNGQPLNGSAVTGRFSSPVPD